LGKLGGRELNYSSDIDLIFLSTGKSSAVAAAAEKFIKTLKEGELEEFFYRVDLRLRPRGQNGSLVMGLQDSTHYYQQQAQEWEYQALIKARAVAGDRPVAARLMASVAPFIWKPWPLEAMEKLREIKKRYEKRTESEGETHSNIKMGFGGIHDVEFVIQMLQLRYACEYPALREGNTFRAMETLRGRKLLKEQEHHILHEAYHFLRRVENRLQLYENRQVFNVPKERLAKRRLARDLGFEDVHGKTAEEAFETQLRMTMQNCREQFERLYYSDSIKT
jgi:glutamate-ammonia-ligase adenylyltransferase